jgi:hypothetical protein
MYIVIHAYDLSEIAEYVDTWIAKGATLHGGVAVAVLPREDEDILIFYQAITMPENA